MLTVIFTSITVPAYADITIITVEGNPAGQDEGNEWAILFNSGNDPVSLSGWGIFSAQGGKSYDLSGNIGACEEKRIFFPGEFVNDGLESLVLYDHAGKVIDSTPTIDYDADRSKTWKTNIPKCETLLKQSPESEPVLESAPEKVNSTSEILENSEKNNAIDFEIIIQENEEFFDNLTSILPYLGIIIALVIVAIILKNRGKRKSDRLSKNNENAEDSGYVTLENAPLLKKFQDMQSGKQSNPSNNIQVKQIIKNKLRIISELQENKVGNNDRLELIKKSLKTGGSFTKEDDDYLKTKYEEYKKITKKKSKE